MPTRTSAYVTWTCPKCGKTISVPPESRRVVCGCGIKNNFEDGSMKDLLVDAAQTYGPGTIMSKYLSAVKWFIEWTGRNCLCGGIIKKMNDFGPDGCLSHMDALVDDIRRSAEKAELPFEENTVRFLIKRSCVKSKKLLAKFDYTRKPNRCKTIAPTADGSEQQA